MHVVFQNRAPAASLKRRKWGLGIPIHIKSQFILNSIGYYTLLVLNWVLYMKYISLAMDAFLD